MTADDRDVRAVVSADTWVFDVDATLFDGLAATTLRPGARALLAHLSSLGKTVILWSSGGADYARRRALDTGVAHHVDRFAGKGPLHDGRHRTPAWIADTDRAVFVDDRPHELPAGVRTIEVRPYLAPNPHDRELDAIIELLGIRRDEARP